MTKATVLLKDKHKRIYIPEAVWNSEGLQVGDYIEIDVIRVERKKPLLVSQR